MAEDEDPILACPTCQTINQPTLVFCPECGTPIPKAPAPDPVISPNQENISPKKRMQRPRLVVVIGLWLLCFPTMILSLIVTADIFFNYRTRSNFMIFWVSVGTVLLTASILYRITRNYLTLPETPKDLSADFTDYAE